ncbi:MAG: membrane protein insertase YidC [Alphaproteobacteria bacterium]
MDSEKRNLMLAVAASIAIMVGFHFFYDKPRLEQAVQEQQGKTATVVAPATEILPMPQPVVVEAENTSQDARISIETPTLKGSLNLRGGRIDDLILKSYKETTDATSPDVTLLAPKGNQKAYYCDFGWVSAQTGLTLPSSQTMWSAPIDTKLTPETPLVLTWTSPEGVLFERHISVDDNYMFYIKDRVKNKSAQPLSLAFYALISRSSPDVASTSYALHEGMVGYLAGSLEETKFKDLDDSAKKSFQSTGGWLGITESKYWLAAILPDQKENIVANYRSVGTEQDPKFQADFLAPAKILQSGAETEETFRFFAGPKSVEILDTYEVKEGVPHFDLAVDFGWFYFITKPLFFVLKWLYNLCGNLGIAIILLTLLIRLLMFPLANKSFKSMAKMKSIQPELARIKEECGDDKMKFNQEMMAFYKREKVNPVSGCLPMVLQIPVFFAIYKVLLISIEMRHAPFFGWIHDLSAPDYTTIFNLFGLIPWAPPSFLMIGALPLLMGLTMFLQQKMNPQPVDPIQAKMFLVMPILFTYMLAQFPAGLVLYWTCTNIFSMAQQWVMTDFIPSMRKK